MVRIAPGFRGDQPPMSDAAAHFFVSVSRGAVSRIILVGI
jgi:hypothetical protein